MLRDDFYASKLSLIRDIAPSRRRLSEVREARNFRASVTFFQRANARFFFTVRASHFFQSARVTFSSPSRHIFFIVAR